jgi:hypothetical protein
MLDSQDLSAHEDSGSDGDILGNCKHEKSLIVVAQGTSLSARREDEVSTFGFYAGSKSSSVQDGTSQVSFTDRSMNSSHPVQISLEVFLS